MAVDLSIYAGIKQVSPPQAEPVSVELARKFLQRSTDAEDDVITELIAAARAQVEADSGLHLPEQEWELAVNGFPSCDRYLKLPVRPVIEVVSVKLFDTADVESTWSTSDYFVDTYSDPARIVLRAGKSWPSSLRDYIAAVIHVRTGHRTLPSWCATAILMRVAAISENRELSRAEQYLYEQLVPRRSGLA